MAAANRHSARARVGVVPPLTQDLELPSEVVALDWQPAAS